MKINLLNFLLSLLPFAVYGQNEPPVYKEFSKHIHSIITSFKLNDNSWVMQTALDKEHFELAAINDQMQVLWRSSFEGYPIAAGKFKGHILAICGSKFSRTTSEIKGPITATLIDEKTGNLILRNLIYDSKSEAAEISETYFNNDWTDVTFIVRQTKQRSICHKLFLYYSRPFGY